MAKIKNCKHQGFAYAKNGYKNIHIICDLDGETHKKEYCRKCEYYEPRTPKETHEKRTETHDNTPKERGDSK